MRSCCCGQRMPVGGGRAWAPAHAHTFTHTQYHTLSKACGMQRALLVCMCVCGGGRAVHAHPNKGGGRGAVATGRVTRAIQSQATRAMGGGWEGERARGPQHTRGPPAAGAAAAVDGAAAAGAVPGLAPFTMWAMDSGCPGPACFGARGPVAGAAAARPAVAAAAALVAAAAVMTAAAEGPAGRAVAATTGPCHTTTTKKGSIQISSMR